MGCYPLFACRDWSQLSADLTDLGIALVSLSIVADPFGQYSLRTLHRCFDYVTPFKEHFVADLRRPIKLIISRHHRYYARKASRAVAVEMCEHPIKFLSDWVSLYAILVRTHNIRGPAALSQASFSKQLSVPGMVAFRALHNGTTVGMTLWYVQGDVAYSHLSAYSDVGYDLRASYALFWTALQHFRLCSLRWVHLGGGAGATAPASEGLVAFKRGWATETRTAYLCGRIFDPPTYQALLEATGRDIVKCCGWARSGGVLLNHQSILEFLSI